MLALVGLDRVTAPPLVRAEPSDPDARQDPDARALGLGRQPVHETRRCSRSRPVFSWSTQLMSVACQSENRFSM